MNSYQASSAAQEIWGQSRIVSVERIDGNTVEWRVSLMNDPRRHYLDKDGKPCCHETCMKVAALEGTNA